jgi:glutathione S-transferase
VYGLLAEKETPMRLYDYGPSQNCFKVRLLAAHLGMALEVVPVSIFNGEGALPAFLAKNSTGIGFVGHS